MSLIFSRLSKLDSAWLTAPMPPHGNKPPVPGFPHSVRSPIPEEKERAQISESIRSLTSIRPRLGDAGGER